MLNKAEKEKIIQKLIGRQFKFKNTTSYQPVVFFKNIYYDFYNKYCSDQFAILCYLYIKKKLVSIANDYSLKGDIIDIRKQVINKYLFIDYIDYTKMVYLTDLLKIKDNFNLSFIQNMFKKINGEQVFVYNGNMEKLLIIQRAFKC